VEVLWIHNQQWKDWERLLPQETKAKLLTDRKGRAGDNKGVHHKSVMEREKFDGELEETLYGGVSVDIRFVFKGFEPQIFGEGQGCCSLLRQCPANLGVGSEQLLCLTMSQATNPGVCLRIQVIVDCQQLAV
jgi:hypothetical protein